MGNIEKNFDKINLKEAFSKLENPKKYDRIGELASRFPKENIGKLGGVMYSLLEEKNIDAEKLFTNFPNTEIA